MKYELSSLWLWLWMTAYKMKFTTINEIECYLFTETFSLCCQCDPWLLTGTVGGSQQKPHLWYVLYPPGFCHPPTSQTLVLIASCSISQPLLKIWEAKSSLFWSLIFLSLKFFLETFSIIHELFQVKMVLWS